jgi:hypothetical protein
MKFRKRVHVAKRVSVSGKNGKGAFLHNPQKKVLVKGSDLPFPPEQGALHRRQGGAGIEGMKRFKIAVQASDDGLSREGRRIGCTGKAFLLQGHSRFPKKANHGLVHVRHVTTDHEGPGSAHTLKPDGHAAEGTSAFLRVAEQAGSRAAEQPSEKGFHPVHLTGRNHEKPFLGPPGEAEENTFQKGSFRQLQIKFVPSHASPPTASKDEGGHGRKRIIGFHAHLLSRIRRWHIHIIAQTPSPFRTKGRWGLREKSACDLSVQRVRKTGADDASFRTQSMLWRLVLKTRK